MLRGLYAINRITRSGSGSTCMGKYSTMFSERGKHTKIVGGYCVICGKHGLLSKDHVSPQGSFTVTKVEQFHLTECIWPIAARH